MYLSLFFFQCSADPRNLHSFPTRRSSDLVLDRRPASASGNRQADPRLRDGPSGNGRLHAASRHVVVDPLVGSRSEEHTSELQSRENLVCRLLLEKKKKNNKKITISYNNKT